MQCDNCNGSCSNKLCMKNIPIFSSLSPKDIARVKLMITHNEYKKGEKLFTENDILPSLVILNEGSVKAYKYTAEGREQILYIFGEGDFFGEGYIFSNKMSSYTVEALEKVKTCMLSREDFQKILQTYPDIAIKIIEELGKRIEQLEERFQSMDVRSVDSRIAAMLLSFKNKYGKPTDEGILIKLPLTREGMANYIGIARETLSRKFGQLENDKILSSISNKNVILLNVPELENLANKDK